MRVVIIDDDMALLRSLDLLLSSRGHDVWVFNDSQKARDFIQDGEEIDALIVDVIMPGGRGDALLESLQGSLKESCRVVLVSGHTDLVEHMDLRAFGVSLFLPKPLDFQALCEALQ